jgi:predicted membrane protein
MSSANTTRPVELTAIVIGVLAIAASAYFIFATEANTYRLTNMVIALAFVVYVVYNFINVRNLRGEVQELNENNSRLISELKQTNQWLTESRSSVEDLKAELIETKNLVAEQHQEILRIKKS